MRLLPWRKKQVTMIKPRGVEWELAGIRGVEKELLGLWGAEPGWGWNQPLYRFLSAEGQTTCSSHHAACCSPGEMANKCQKKGNCAFNCPQKHAGIAPAPEPPSCSSCANGHLSCSKYWANFITFGFCLSTQHFSNGVLVAMREWIRLCLALRWGMRSCAWGVLAGGSSVCVATLWLQQKSNICA